MALHHRLVRAKDRRGRAQMLPRPTEEALELLRWELLRRLGLPIEGWRDYVRFDFHDNQNGLSYVRPYLDPEVWTPAGLTRRVRDWVQINEHPDNALHRQFDLTDETDRLVLSDMLEDENRDDEARILRTALANDSEGYHLPGVRWEGGRIVYNSPPIEALLDHIGRAAGRHAVSHTNPTGIAAYYDAGQEQPWRIADDYASESFATPHEAATAAWEWAQQFDEDG